MIEHRPTQPENFPDPKPGDYERDGVRLTVVGMIRMDTGSCVKYQDSEGRTALCKPAEWHAWAAGATKVSE